MRVILVTGANGGLGQAIARTFLDEAPDNFVWLAVHKNSDRAAKLASEFVGRCAPVNLNVSTRVAWDNALKQVLTQHERIDVLVNNAGRHRDGLLGTLEESAWEEVISTNLNGVFHGCQAVLPPMISQ